MRALPAFSPRLLLFLVPLGAFACSADKGGSGDDGADGAADSGGTDGTDGTDGGAPMTLSAPGFLSSEGHALADRCAFKLPPESACEGPSPELVWTEIPAGAVELVLLLDDPDAGDWPHWAVVHLPADGAGLAAAVSQSGAESALPAGAVELENGAGYDGYYGSCPGRAHVYRWRLWAVSEPVEDPGLPNAKNNFSALATAAEGVSLGSAELCHIYDPNE